MLNLVNGTVWLPKTELSDLFDTKYRTIDRHINDIIENNRIDIEKSCNYHTIINTSRNNVKYDPYEFNLEFIITLAFRIDSPNAEGLRKWFMEQLLNPTLINIYIPIFRQRHEWN